MPHLDILFENSEHNGPGKFVGVSSDKGCDPGIGEWMLNAEGFWAYRIQVVEGTQHEPMLTLSDERWAHLIQASNVD